MKCMNVLEWTYAHIFIHSMHTQSCTVYILLKTQNYKIVFYPVLLTYLWYVHLQASTCMNVFISLTSLTLTPFSWSCGIKFDTRSTLITCIPPPSTPSTVKQTAAANFFRPSGEWYTSMPWSTRALPESNPLVDFVTVEWYPNGCVQLKLNWTWIPP